MTNNNNTGQPWGTPPPPVPPQGYAVPGFVPAIPPKKRKVWPWVAGGVAVLAVIGIGSGGGSDKPSTAAATETTEASAFHRSSPTTEAVVESGPRTTFGNGTFLVGKQIAPGTYQAPGGSNCYYERRSNTSADFDGIIANEWSTDKSQQIVTIDPSDVAFKSKGCGTWTPVQ